MHFTNALPVEPPPQAPSAPAPVTDLWRSKELRSTLAFVCAPVLLFLAATFLDTDVPSPIFYAMVAVMVPMMLWRVKRDPEWVMAAFILYIPQAKSYVLPVLPGINATNVLMAGMLVAWVARSRREGRPMFASMPLGGVMWAWAILSTLSFVTAIFTRGLSEFLDLRVGFIRVWLDQFFVFFAFLALIRDGAMARRIAVYLCIGGAVVTLCGFAEWLQKGDASSIEKSRLLGPLQQPNDLAAFLVYSSGPFVALFVQYMFRARTWLLLPYLVMVARVLLGAFSRGGYIGYAVEALVALSLRGKLILIAAIGAAVLIFTTFPEVLPDSMVARINETHSDETPQGLDKSSETRLILWNAALKMVEESPIFGKGFYTFPFLKAQYTEVEVMESDNHNMYLYIASQMGVPALLALLAVFARLYLLGSRVYRRATDGWARVVGLGAASMCGGALAVNMFGSRLLDVSVMGYVWMYAAVISHLWCEVRPQPVPFPDDLPPPGARA